MNPDMSFTGSGDEDKAASVFLMIDPFSISAAFGSAYTARAKNSRVLHFNPAGLAGMECSEAQLTCRDRIADIDYNYLSLFHTGGAGPWMIRTECDEP